MSAEPALRPQDTSSIADPQPRRGSRSRARPPSTHPRILMTTEGTFPYAMGGVSSWCHVVIGGLPDFRWLILPIHAGSRKPAPMFELAPNARMAGRIDVWCEQLPPRRLAGALRRGSGRPALAGELARQLIGWDADPLALVELLAWCRERPDAVRRTFRSIEAWNEFVLALQDIVSERSEDSAPPPELDTVDAASLYQRLYWVARAAAVPTPDCEVLHVTAAGWAAIPALVHKRIHGTPLLLTEHGVYVREAYLAAARNGGSPGERFLATRLARGLSLATYAMADVVAPVTEANAAWEIGLGVDPAKVCVIHNGIPAPLDCERTPGQMKIVSVGRIDPLKDVQTMLRVAREVCRREPAARFEYWGPVTPGEDAYARACRELLRQLDLGERFRFMGSTNRPDEVLRSADVVLLTSISEGMPMAILEAMAQGRPVVATGVGGVPDVLRGCGVVAPSGDIGALANGVLTLLRDPVLTATLSRRGFDRVCSRYTQSMCLARYRALLGELAASGSNVVPFARPRERAA